MGFNNVFVLRKNQLSVGRLTEIVVVVLITFVSLVLSSALAKVFSTIDLFGAIDNIICRIDIV